MRKQITSIFVIIAAFSLFLTDVSRSDVILITPPEEVVQQAPIIAEGEIQDISFHEGAHPLTSYASITLSVTDLLKGTSPSTVVFRRYAVTSDNKFLKTHYIPTYSKGDHVIVTLRQHAAGYYEPLGLKNGTFHIVDEKVRGTDISLQQFRLLIEEILAGIRDAFPTGIQELEASDLTNSFSGHIGKTGGENSRAEIMSTGSHLGGAFEAQDHSWNKTEVPVQFYYNPNNAPASTSTVLGRINAGLDAWNAVSLSFFEFSRVESVTLCIGVLSGYV